MRCLSFTQQLQISIRFFFQLHDVGRVSLCVCVKTLRSLLSTKYLGNCVLSGGYQRRVLTREEIIFLFPRSGIEFTICRVYKLPSVTSITTGLSIFLNLRFILYNIIIHIQYTHSSFYSYQKMPSASV